MGVPRPRTAVEVGEQVASAGEWAGVQRLLQLARGHLGMDIAWVSQFIGDEQVIRAVDGDAAAMNVTVGEGTPLAGSFCVRVLAGTIPAVISAARRHPVTRELDVTHALGIGSYVGAPLYGRNGPAGEPVGMLCCLSRSPNPVLDEQASAFLGLLADLISDHLRTPEALERKQTRGNVERVEALLDAGGVRMLFQPIVRLDDGDFRAYEALARFDDPHFPTPAHAFAAAARVGLGTELELLAVKSAFEHLEQRPSGAGLGVNLSADALLTPAVRHLLLAHADRSIIVEVTEHTQVRDYDRLIAVTRELQAAGIHIAVDDARAGYASFRHILRLRPEAIKLDIEMIRGVDTDPVKQALTEALAGFRRQDRRLLDRRGHRDCCRAHHLKRVGRPAGPGIPLRPTRRAARPGERSMGRAP